MVETSVGDFYAHSDSESRPFVHFFVDAVLVGMSISDDISKWAAWAAEAATTISGLYSAGKITEAVYNTIKGKLDDIQSKLDELSQGDGIVGDAELVAEVSAEVSEVSTEIAAAVA